jgi:periplasmic protein TonB
MSSYRGTADRPDQAKAVAAVVAVHVALAFIILTGLNVRMARQVAQHLTTIDIKEPPPPPPVKPPPPARKPRQMKKPPGVPAPRAEPTPVVAPPPRLPVTSPIPAAGVAGTGAASTSGASTYGAGTGTGGTGYGAGGYGGFTPAQKITKIPDREYRRLAALSGMERGTVGLSIRVNPDGSASNCRIVRPSGSPPADALMCQLTEQYVRFRPARDASGRPIAQDVTWYPNWWRPYW